MRSDNKKSKKDLERTISFLEDLCWLLDSNKRTNYNDILKFLSEIRKNQDSSISSQLGQEPDELIGILPRLLTDTSLFDTNRNLAQFSSEVLNIEILNWHKRSRNEMIGVIICKVQESEEVRNGISSYVLANILKNKDKIKKIRKESENINETFLWNDAIHKIVGDTHNE